ncbi:MAG TPA: VOC family protein [Acidimicrobiia bacterium]|nr:VOC family protein [Acidimicrobiia bacterium]
MQHEIELGYIGIEVPEPDALNEFFGDFVGLVPGDATDDGAVTWRNDDKAQRVIIQRGAANDAVFVGFEAVDEDAFDAVAARLASAGHAVTEGSDADLRTLRVKRLIRASTPWDIPVEVVLALEDSATPFTSPRMPGGFLTQGVGFGHAVFATTAFDASHAFLVDGLGLRQSDWLEMEIAEGIELEVRFYHCNERHHSVALAKAPFDMPQTLHHIMFETNERDDVGAAFDRVWGTDLAIANGLGRHDNDGMFSFYVVSPAGFQVEIGHGARTITESWTDNRRYDRISRWGHQQVQRP